MIPPQLLVAPDVAHEDLAHETTAEYARRMMLGAVSPPDLTLRCDYCDARGARVYLCGNNEECLVCDRCAERDHLTDTMRIAA